MDIDVSGEVSASVIAPAFLLVTHVLCRNGYGYRQMFFDIFRPPFQFQIEINSGRNFDWGFLSPAAAFRAYQKGCAYKWIYTPKLPKLNLTADAEYVANLWSPYVIGQTIYIFMLWFVLLLLLFSSPNLSRRRLDVCHTSTHGVALVRI